MKAIPTFLLILAGLAGCATATPDPEASTVSVDAPAKAATPVAPAASAESTERTLPEVRYYVIADA